MLQIGKENAVIFSWNSCCLLIYSHHTKQCPFCQILSVALPTIHIQKKIQEKNNDETHLQSEVNFSQVSMSSVGLSTSDLTRRILCQVSTLLWQPNNLSLHSF